jgi:16S rRNA (adenine1518-N6/adenine1519-N6)-dimethyltransferase
MPRRKWGQHFLRDGVTARRLVERSGVQPGETVLEIGPGTGRLTRALQEVAGHVVALEIDPVLAGNLPGQVADPERLTVVEGNAAGEDLGRLLERTLEPGARVRAVGNLPYESATAILARLLDAARHLTGIAVLVQREVAERIVSPPGRRSYGYLSVLCQDVAEPEITARLRPGAFRPPPAVDSALVRLRLREAPLRGDLDGEQFRGFVGGLFQQRRKTILNNLQSAAGISRDAAHLALEEAALDPGLRPEALSVIELARLLRATLPDASEPEV